MPTEPETGTVYVLVRTDLGESQRLVQAVHAVAGLIGNHPGGHVEEWAIHGGTLVALGVEHEQAVWDWSTEPDLEHLPGFVFCEPDLGGEPTAFAVFDYPGGSLRKIFRLLPLL